ncbi:hypothetical protein [Streptomyces griseorubiginosus]|uniref:hypothetical protein n=1 Tax=Streptomyces griseorubiginosus TaxID=67304 RepID=UPI0036E37E79
MSVRMMPGGPSSAWSVFTDGMLGAELPADDVLRGLADQHGSQGIGLALCACPPS